MPTNKTWIAEAETYVTRLFHHKIDARHPFHNIDHTRSVVASVREMAQYYNLSDEDRLALELAAWFHDTGYAHVPSTSHETESVRIFREFIANSDFPPTLVDKIEACIMATRMPQKPNGLLEQIICDADLYHLGTSNFVEKTKRLRRELNQYSGTDLSKKEWRQKNIRFLNEHRYFTEYAQLMLDAGKRQNLHRLIDKDEHEKNTEAVAPAPVTASESTAPAATEKKPATRNERSITTMFRIMSSNHNDLSSMADSKAHIMISVNSIIISILISVLLGRLAYYRNLIVPTMILIVTSVSAIVFAVLATRPKISTGTFSEEDIRSKKVNLLFFGNFYNMKLEEYNWAMNEMMNDRNYLYDSMIKDIYHLGVILAKKYKYLRLSYTIFMFGLVISVLAFGIAMFFPSQTGSIP